MTASIGDTVFYVPAQTEPPTTDLPVMAATVASVNEDDSLNLMVILPGGETMAAANVGAFDPEDKDAAFWRATLTAPKPVTAVAPAPTPTPKPAPTPAPSPEPAAENV